MLLSSQVVVSEDRLSGPARLPIGEEPIQVEPRGPDDGKEFFPHGDVDPASEEGFVECQVESLEGGLPLEAGALGDLQGREAPGREVIALPDPICNPVGLGQDADAPPPGLAVRALEGYRGVRRRAERKTPPLDPEGVSKLGLEAPEANRRRVAPRSEVI